MRIHRVTQWTILLAFFLFLLACGGGESASNGDNQDSANQQGAQGTQQVPSQLGGDHITIKMVYSPEKEEWLQERIQTFHNQGETIGDRPIFVQSETLSSGEARTRFKQSIGDVTIWSPSASTWLEVLKQETGNQNIAHSQKPLLLTPVVVSMWRPMAEAMGWPERSLGWSNFLDLINDPQGWGKFGHPEWGKFSWGHTDPEVSTTALSTLIAEFYAAAGKQQGLTIQDVQSNQAISFVRDLGQGIKHYGYNTLVFSENMRKFGMSYISAFPMEEATLIDFNQAAPPTPLVAIYPKEGTFWHDNPYIVFAAATAEQKEAAQVFYDFLLTEESQRLAMEQGFRPANIDIELADPISEAYGVKPQGVQNVLEVPNAEVIVAAKNSWRQNRKRADIMLVVDVSGSMQGEKLQMLKAGLESFLQRILPEDRVGLITFDSKPTMAVEPAPLSENRIPIQTAIQNMEAFGDTALFDGVAMAQQTIEDLPPMAESRIRAIVLLSDGADNASSRTLGDLQQGEGGISIFPVAYGDDADMEVLNRIADFSRTIVVQGSTGDIAQIFQNLSRYF